MNRQITFFFIKILSFCILSVNAQKKMNLNVRTYYLDINKAELFIVDSNYTKALKEYTVAFRNNDIAFAKDYFNASLCALKLKKINVAKNFMFSLAKKGVPLNVIIQTAAYKKNFPKNLESKFSKKYLTLYSTSEKKRNSKVGVFLNTLYNNDQKFRQDNDSYVTNADSIKAIDKKNDSLLIEYIKKNGFPNENIIGTNERFDCMPGFSLVIWHQTKENHYHEYTDILINAVKTGKILPQVAAAIIDNHTGNNNYGIDFVVRAECEDKAQCDEELKKKIYNKIFIKTNSPQKINAINNKRDEIYLENMNDYIKKMKFLAN